MVSEKIIINIIIKAIDPSLYSESKIKLNQHITTEVITQMNDS